MILSFEKIANRWYLIAPDWPGDHAELQMVAGADTLLDNLTIFDKINLELYAYPFWMNEWLNNKKKFIKNNPNLRSFIHAKQIKTTGNYITDGGHKFWLCPVTLWLFGQYPKHFWFAPKQEE